MKQEHQRELSDSVRFRVCEPVRRVLQFLQDRVLVPALPERSLPAGQLRVQMQ